MTASTAAYAIGRGKPPLHSRFQKGQSGNPSGKPGPAKLLKMRFQQALLAALEEAPEALELSKPQNGIAGMARRMALDAVAGRGAAQRLVLSRLDAECEREAQTAPERNEADPFSLAQGESEGGGIQCLEEMLWPAGFEDGARIDDDSRAERAAEAAPAASTRGRKEADPFSLVQGESQGGGGDFAEAVIQMEGYPSPATAQVSSAVPANLSHKGRGEIRRMALSGHDATFDRNETEPFSLAQGKTQGNGKNPEKICVAVAASRAPSAAPVHTAMRAQLMMGTAAMASAPAFPARLNRQSALGHSLVERAACSSRIYSG